VPVRPPERKRIEGIAAGNGGRLLFSLFSCSSEKEREAARRHNRSFCEECLVKVMSC